MIKYIFILLQFINEIVGENGFFIYLELNRLYIVYGINEL